jgi:hypothetical protein
LLEDYKAWDRKRDARFDSLGFSSAEKGSGVTGEQRLTDIRRGKGIYLGYFGRGKRERTEWVLCLLVFG